MAGVPSQEELEAACCWERDDQIPRRPEMTVFRRAVRYRQAQWREAHGHPIGSQPIGGGRPVGSRLPLDYARESGANFLTPGAFAAAQARMSVTEPHQSVDHQRLWADLLSSQAFAFNLFAALDDPDRVVRVLAPDAPGTTAEIRFCHSPGWLDPSYLGSLRSFDAAFVLDLGDGTHGVVAVDVKYHEWMKPETPRPENLSRYLEVAERSRAFAPGAVETVKGRGPLAVMWLEHLLLLSMLQHASAGWRSGRYVVVHPAGNTDYADGCAHYRELLADPSTFASLTLEELLAAKALPAARAGAIRERYAVPT
jgi:hypothetical protein